MRRRQPSAHPETDQRLAAGAAALFSLLAFAFIANPLAHFVSELAQ